MNRSTSYILHPSVFYSTINEKVALYYTARTMLYTFNSFSKVIFDFFREERSIQSLFEHLEENYQFDLANEEAAKGLEDFLNDLIQNKIIIQLGKVSEYPGTLENDVSDEFAESRKLFSATIELTYRCNERCRHCYVYDEGGKELSTEQVKKLLDDLHDMGVLAILFTGGEVFVRNDIFEILEYAHEKHFAIDIFTNGALLDGDKIIKLKALWLKGIHFSVYSHIPEKHDAITQVKGSFEKTLKALKSCSLIGIPTKIKAPIFSETIDDVEGIISLARKVGASISINNDITPKKNGDTSPLSMRVLSRPEQKDISSSIEEQLGNLYKEPHRDKKTPRRICSAGAKMVSINPYGKVYPCGCFPLCIGDVTKQSIEDIWNNSEQLNDWRMKNLASNRVECESCQYYNYCRYCPGEAMMYTGNCTSKYPDACYVAEHKAKFFHKSLSEGGENA